MKHDCKISAAKVFIIFIIMIFPSCIHSDSSLINKHIIISNRIDLKPVYRRLENAGFNPGPYNKDDLIQFSQAVKRFQETAKLRADGVLNELTRAKIQELYDPMESGSRKSSKAIEDKEKPSLKTEDIKPLTPSINIRNYPININDRAFAVETFECSDISGDWIIFYEGIVTDKKEDTISIRLENRFGYRYHPEKQGIDRSDWWCIPKKRHCYSPVKFSDWGGKHSEGQTVTFPKNNVYNAKIRIINGISLFLQENCSR